MKKPAAVSPDSRAFRSRSSLRPASHAEAVARRLRRARVLAGGVRIKAKLAKRLGGGRFPLLTRSRKLARPSDDAATLTRVSLELYGRIPNEPIRLVGVAAYDLSSAEREQLSLLDDPELERNRALDRVLDDVRERFGSDALVRGVSGPERAGLSLGVKRGEDP